MWLWFSSCSPSSHPTTDKPDNRNEVQDTATEDDTGLSEPIVEPVCTAHNLRVIPLNIWGEDIRASMRGLGLLESIQPSGRIGYNETLYPLKTDTSLSIQIEMDGYYDAEITLQYNALGFEQSAFTTQFESEDGVTVQSWDILEIGEMICPTYTVFVGLEHKFFASTGKQPTLNKVDFLPNGEAFWGSVAEDLPFTQQNILYSTWWWESDFELIRDSDPYLSEAQRYDNRLMSFIHQSPARKRILINQFWADNTDLSIYLNTDTELRDSAESTQDDIEVMIQPNTTVVDIGLEYPTPDLSVDFASRVLANPNYSRLNLHTINLRSYAFDLASWHQKFIVMDSDVAYVTGMNSKQTDWDSDGHLLFDPRRMDYDASVSERIDVANSIEIATLEPRRDYGVRIEGPIVSEIQEVFSERWDLARGNAVYAENTTDYSPEGTPPTIQNGVMAQLQLTQPNPLEEVSLLDGHLQAIRQAQHYILIEDQYFRAPILNEAILEQMYQEPELLLIVVTMDVPSYDPALKYTYLSARAFQDAFPDRFQLLTLASTEVLWDVGAFFDTAEIYNEPIFIHSKLRIIDDEYLSVGSGNMNNRGYKYEGEMNLSIWDPTWVQQQRELIFHQYVGESFAEYLTTDAQNNFDVLQWAAESNAYEVTWWNDNGFWMNSPEEMVNEWNNHSISGFVFPLEFSTLYIDIVSPDVF